MKESIPALVEEMKRYLAMWRFQLTVLSRYQYHGMPAMVNVAITQQQSGEAIRLLERLVQIDGQDGKRWELSGSLFLQRSEAAKAEFGRR